MKDIRQKMESTLKGTFRKFVLRLHGEEELTQLKLANALLMDRRSLVDIENGEHMCGELTIILLLIYMEDTDPFLQQLRQELELVYNHANSFYDPDFAAQTATTPRFAMKDHDPKISKIPK